MGYRFAEAAQIAFKSLVACGHPFIKLVCGIDQTLLGLGDAGCKRREHGFGLIFGLLHGLSEMAGCSREFPVKRRGAFADLSVERLKRIIRARGAFVHRLQNAYDRLNLAMRGISRNADLICRILCRAGHDRQMIAKLFKIGHRRIAGHLQHFCPLVGIGQCSAQLRRSFG